ncbi:MAG: lipid hydroperoxide peroxidase [Bacteroidetes bacterium GWF2_33_16]|nr:MAG: lipid hydroperoxide peroxidase [Bacteroidetes bacterium GWE2_32_14]OFY07106.1 MAG: lipid hydroperoxide peroxidase [Bacteroidetes bacterium GWF2_33_16]
MEKNKSKVKFKNNPVTLVGNEIKVNNKAPDFTVLNNSLEQVKLSDYKGKVKILSIYPSIDTGICSKQAHTFNNEAGKLEKDIIILSLSNDLPFALTRFCGAEGINNLVTLSDHKDLDFALKYGFLIEELRLLARGIVVIDKLDVVRHVEFVPEITTEPNYESALNIAKSCI